MRFRLASAEDPIPLSEVTRDDFSATTSTKHDATVRPKSLSSYSIKEKMYEGIKMLILIKTWLLGSFLSMCSSCSPVPPPLLRRLLLLPILSPSSILPRFCHLSTTSSSPQVEEDLGSSVISSVIFTAFSGIVLSI